MLRLVSQGLVRVCLLMGVLSLGLAAHADRLERDVNKALSRIGVAPEQVEAFQLVYNDFLQNRNMQVRRVLNSRRGEELPVMVRKRVNRAARKSVKAMREVLDSQQLEYYERYLELANELFIRDAGLR